MAGKKTDLSKQKFGKLTVIERGEPDSGGRVRWSCLCECTNTCLVRAKHLQSGRVMSCGCDKTKRGPVPEAELKNAQIGKLTLLEKVFVEVAGGKQPAWRCWCECNTEKVIRQSSLLAGLTASCGCQTAKSGSGSTNWEGCGELPKRHYSIVKSVANKRGLEFAVSLEYLWDLYRWQGGKCLLTGLPIEFSSLRADEAQTASLDRIRSSTGGFECGRALIGEKLGYVPGNVWWVHKIVNVMKNAFSLKEFVEICKLVTANPAFNGDYSGLPEDVAETLKAIFEEASPPESPGEPRTADTASSPPASPRPPSPPPIGIRPSGRGNPSGWGREP